MRSSSSAERPTMARQVSAGISAWDLVEVDAGAGVTLSDAEPQAQELEPQDDVGTDVEALLEAAEREQELAETLERERAEWERQLRGAYERGLADGHAEGKKSEEVRLSGALDATERALSQIRASGSRWASALEENVCALAVAVARHILDRELQSDPVAVLGLVRSAVARFRLDEPIRIRVSERDHEVLLGAESDEEELAALVAGREVVWIADAAVEVGGCIVEGPDRIVDGRVDTALERVYRRLTQTHA